MIPSKVMAKLATAGFSEEQAILVASMLSDVEEATADAIRGEVETTLEAGREKARNRWHKWDEKRRSNVGKRLPTAATVSGTLAHTEDKTLTSESTQKEESKKVSRGARLPSDFALPAEWFQWALARGLPASRIPVEFEKLCNWAANAPAGKAVKKDWFKAWQNWVIGAIDALPQNRAPPASQAAPSMSQLLSIVRDHPHEIEPGPPEDRSGFRAAIPDLRPARAG